jgi:hypothetical protein
VQTATAQPDHRSWHHTAAGSAQCPANGPGTHRLETSISPTTPHDPAAAREMTQSRPEQDLEQSALKVGSRCRPAGDLKTPSVEPVQALGVHGFPPGDISPPGLMRVSFGLFLDVSARHALSGSAADQDRWSRTCAGLVLAKLSGAVGNLRACRHLTGRRGPSSCCRRGWHCSPRTSRLNRRWRSLRQAIRDGRTADIAQWAALATEAVMEAASLVEVPGTSAGTFATIRDSVIDCLDAVAKAVEADDAGGVVSWSAMPWRTSPCSSRASSAEASPLDEQLQVGGTHAEPGRIRGVADREPYRASTQRARSQEHHAAV